MTVQRVVFVLGAALVWMVAAARPAHADPAGPTDFQTSVVEIEPPIDGLEVEIIGGDSFVLLTVEFPAEVEVVGYRGEPYLRFLPGGVVERNDLAPTTYLNEDRYAVVDIPEEASAASEPVWRRVAEDGSYAWHDHRAHWMNEEPPPGRGPGDVILEGVVPLVVDGIDVDVTVRSVWEPTPSRVAPIAGLVIGSALTVAVFGRRLVPTLAIAVALLAAVALVVGLIGYLSVPAETGPSPILWAGPGASLVLAVAAASSSVGGGPRTAPLRKAAPGLVAAGAVILAVWGVIRWEWLWKAILPTAAPFWFDRLVTAAAVVGGSGLVAATLRARLSGAPEARRLPPGPSTAPGL
jgi:hypothetical protein